MTTSHAVQASDLTDGATILVSGILAYSRLTRQIDGDELVKANQAKQSRGMYPVSGPYTTVTITEAQVQPADPQNPTIDERYVAERCYQSKQNPSVGLSYTLDSLGSMLPIIAIPSPDDPGKFVQDTSGQELASGQAVTLVLRVYKTQKMNRGVALAQVVVLGTPKYYAPMEVGLDELAARGIVFAVPPQPVSAKSQVPQPVGQDEPVASSLVGGMALPAPMAAASQPMATRGTASTPAMYPAVAHQVAPSPAPAPVASASSMTMQDMAARLAELEKENKSLRDVGSPIGTPVIQGPWGPVNPEIDGIA